MTEQVAISVIMPVYNTPGYILQRAVRSVTDQVGLNDVQHELVVVDDGSTAAATLETLHKLKTYDGVRVLRIGKNSGQSTARNVGVFAARGGLLAFLDADDIMFGTSLALHYHHIEQGYDFVFSQFALMDHVDGKARIGQIAESVVPLRGEPYMIVPVGQLEMLFRWRQILKLGNLTLLGTVMMDRRDYIRAGGCEPDLVCSEDWLLERRLFDTDNIEVYYIKEPTLWYCRYDISYDLNQSRKLHEPNTDAFHLDTQHSSGKAGEYLDKRACARADKWIEGLSQVIVSDIMGVVKPSQAHLFDLPDWEEV